MGKIKKIILAMFLNFFLASFSNLDFYFYTYNNISYSKLDYNYFDNSLINIDDYFINYILIRNIEREKLIKSIYSNQKSYTLGIGASMATVYMEILGLFNLHIDNCDSATENFVDVISVNGVTLGFCIEKNERSQARWDIAVETCMSVGKRLPEPYESKLACIKGKISPTNEQWSSNFANYGYSGVFCGAQASIFGGGGNCNYGQSRWIGRTGTCTGTGSGTNETRVFRCVR